MARVWVLPSLLFVVGCATPPPLPASAPIERGTAAWGDCRKGEGLPMADGRVLRGDNGFAEYLPENDTSWVRRLQMIESATRKIRVQYFILEPDAYGKALLGALLVKQRAGVQVSLMVDAVGSPALSKPLLGKDYLEELASAGAEVHIFAPLFATLRPRLFGSNHDKLVIVDDCLVLTGGRNVGRRYFDAPSVDPKVYADADILVEGAKLASWANGAYRAEAELARNRRVRPEVANRKSRAPELLAAYATALATAKRHPAWRKDWRPRHAGLIRIFDGESRFHSPQIRDASFATEDLIRGAKRGVVISNPYVVLSADMLDAFRAAAKRGIPITLLTNSPLSTDSLPTQAVFQREWPSLLREIPTLRIFASKGPAKLHAKSMVIDDDVAVVGSYNLDSLSDRINSELFVAVESKPLAREISTHIKRQIRDNTVEYRLVEGRAVGAEQLDAAKEIRRIRWLEDAAQIFRDKL